jgi:ferredoxin
MSKKDGKATLLRSVLKKNVYVLAVSKSLQEKTAETALVCPVKIIKVM